MATADSWRDAIIARLLELRCIQADFDALAWAKGILLEVRGVSKYDSGKQWLKAKILTQKEWEKVTTTFKASPLSLKNSKPSQSYNQRNPGTLATWNENRAVAKLLYISETTFPSQKGSFP